MDLARIPQGKQSIPPEQRDLKQGPSRKPRPPRLVGPGLTSLDILGIVLAYLFALVVVFIVLGG